MVKVIFIHPDLGIGGAERLVIDAAMALKNKSHRVSFLTAHHDPNHCFPETINGELTVTCAGDWLPRSTIGYLYAFWAYVRMIYITLYLVLFSNVEYDVAFVDQISACIPVLKLRKSKILFYCHYPDQLLTERRSFLKRVYRYFIDFLEERTTALADITLVNSKFTASVFEKTFSSIQKEPTVLYPSLDFSKFDQIGTQDIPQDDATLALKDKIIFLSLNRYERKKRIDLAINAFDLLLDLLPESYKCKVHLIVAGGYDGRVLENINYFNELKYLAEEMDILQHVTFLKSPSDESKISLLTRAKCLLYTPDKEHFGIIPIEAMYMGTPVIAVNSGGPLETVVSGKTGYLVPQDTKSFAEHMNKFVVGDASKEIMGKNSHEHVVKNFSFSAFADHLDSIITALADCRKEE